MSGTVLVTGGTRGIGRAIVEHLVGEGLRVGFTWLRSRDAAESLEAATGGRARGWRFDLADRTAASELVASVEAVLGPLSGLVNNAGDQLSELAAFTSDEAWDRMMDLDLGGAFRCCRAALKGMVARRQGAIVNLASLSALRGVPGHGAYAAAKGGLIAFSRCLAREVGGRGVRVNVVVPGFVATDMTADLSPEVVDRLRAHEALAGGVRPADVAHAVGFLLSERAAAITGHCLVVDAGVSA